LSVKGDNWKVIVPSGELWKRSDAVKFQHVDTNQWLTSPNKKFQHPIPGQREIAAIAQQFDIEWIAEEGFYFPS